VFAKRAAHAGNVMIAEARLAARSVGGFRAQLRRKPWPGRPTSWTSITTVTHAILINAPTLGGGYLVQGHAVAISRTTCFCALFGGLGRRKSERGEVCFVRIQRSRTRRQKHCGEYAEEGKRPLDTFHGQPL